MQENIEHFEGCGVVDEMMHCPQHEEVNDHINTGVEETLAVDTSAHLVGKASSNSLSEIVNSIHLLSATVNTVVRSLEVLI
jgi:hypothetical protein